MTEGWRIVAVGFGGAIASWATVGAVRDAALRRGLLDLPNARSSHAQPTPRLGGLGIVAAVLAALVLAALLGLQARRLMPLLALACVVALVSLVDDLRGLPALLRLAVHLAVAGAAVWVLDLAPAGSGLSPFVIAGLAVAWIAFFLNAFNFMDGIDGIAAAQGLVAAAAWALIGWQAGDVALAVLATAIAAACLGFLPHNWSPASIFMGDVGSAFLGFLLAAAPLALVPAPGGAAGPAWSATVVPLGLTVWPFVFDTTLTLIRRARRGENLMAAHRTHLYQRLTQAGWPHGRVAALYAVLATVGAALAVPLALAPATAPGPGMMAAALVGIAGIGLWGLVVRAERRHGRRSGSAGAARVVEESHRA